jgi:hypothetical protein
LAWLTLGVHEQPTYVAAFVTDRLMNRGQPRGIRRADVVEAAHRHLARDAATAIGQNLQCAECQHVAQADDRSRNSITI